MNNMITNKTINDNILNHSLILHISLFYFLLHLNI